VIYIITWKYLLTIDEIPYNNLYCASMILLFLKKFKPSVYTEHPKPPKFIMASLLIVEHKIRHKIIEIKLEII